MIRLLICYIIQAIRCLTWLQVLQTLLLISFLVIQWIIGATARHDAPTLIMRVGETENQFFSQSFSIFRCSLVHAILLI